MITQIPKEELINGAYYTGASDEAKIATWNAEKDTFEYMLDGKIKSVQYFDKDKPEVDGFFALLRLDNFNTDVIKTGKLQIV